MAQMKPLPRTLFGYVWRYSGRHQAGLVVLSTIVFALSAVPLELQRRIVNDAIYEGAWQTVLWLAVAYAGVALFEGMVKLGLNIYRAWVSEAAVRHLRFVTLAAADGRAALPKEKSVELSMVLSEVEPVGGFVGSSTSEPLLQGGILAAVFGYMVYLDPWLAALSLLVFSPQFVFVPLIQAAINRRVQKRVMTMRGVSHGIVGASPAGQHRRIRRVFTLHMGMWKLKFTMNFLMNLSHHLGVAGALALGGWYVMEGRIELGTVVAFISGLAKVNDPWGDIVNWFRDMTVNRVKYRLLADALERMQTVDVSQKHLRPAA
jgi:ABC-type bacteriocin/lantibiotic exporter with double-glycine peptidase domain